MDEYSDQEVRVDALTAAIKIAPNNIGGDSSRIVDDARRFYDFIAGDAGRPVEGTYRLTHVDS